MASIVEPLVKVRYGEFITPKPSPNTIANFAPFQQRAKLGRSYNFPIYLGGPHGVTWSDTHTAAALKAVIAPVTKEATLSGAEMMIRDNVAYADVFATEQAALSGADPNAFMGIWDFTTMGLMQSGELYREAALMYGPGPTSTAAANVGVINASVSGADLDAGQVVNITTGTWIPGLWPHLATGALVDVYQTDGSTLRAADVVVSSVVESQNRMTLTKAGSAVVVAATDVLVLRGAIDVSMYGLEAIATNAGTIFGISAATYPQWRVGSHAVANTSLSRLDVLSIGAKVKHRGLSDGGSLFVSTGAFTDLAEEAAELKRTTTDTKLVRQGATDLVYDTPCGPITIESYSYMKQSRALFLPSGNTASGQGKVKRVGSTDLTFNNGKNEFFYSELPDNMGSQLRIYMDQAIVIEEPWLAVWVTGIVSTADTTPS